MMARWIRLGAIESQEFEPLYTGLAEVQAASAAPALLWAQSEAEYLFALVFVNTPEKKTLPLGLASVTMQAQYKTDFGLMFAGLVIILVPTLLTHAVLQRHLTRGITVGALKG